MINTIVITASVVRTASLRCLGNSIPEVSDTKSDSTKNGVSRKKNCTTIPMNMLTSIIRPPFPAAEFYRSFSSSWSSASAESTIFA